MLVFITFTNLIRIVVAGVVGASFILFIMSSSPTSRAFHFGTSCDYAVSEVECTYTETMHQPFEAIQSLVAMPSLEQFVLLIKMLTCRATEHAIAPVHHLPPESEKRIDVVKKMKVDNFFTAFTWKVVNYVLRPR